MFQGILVGIAAILVAALMPVVLLSPVEADHPAADKLVIIEAETAAEAKTASAVMETTIRLQNGTEIQELPLEEYLSGVLLSEMPMSFEMEALKAQAVAARTFAVRQMAGGKHEDFDVCGQSNCCQAWTSQQALREKLGDQWQPYWNRAGEAVSATAGQVLTFEGTLIDAVYFSCSGGRTEEAAAVWGGDVPYLQSVDSPGEEEAARYTSQVEVSLETFRQILPEASLTGNPSGWFGGCTRTKGGGVNTLVIGGQTYSGTELRKRFHLNSTLFEISVTEDQIIFEVQGFGHRVGMSQYGANAMAADGSDYREILAHYYPGSTLEERAE